MSFLNTFVFIFRPAPKNEDEMMVAIFEYIDRWLNFDSKLLLMKLKPNTLINLIYLWAVSRYYKVTI